jgi:hypothetical protein
MVEAGFGAIETAMTGAAATVTAATSLLEVSATLVAATWNVPTTPGAVYFPEEDTVPPVDSCTNQVTALDWLASRPVTAALNATVPPGATETACGLTVTDAPADATGV